MDTELIDKNDIFINQEFKSNTDYFQKTYQVLLKEGKVKKKFIDNILQREKDYPTGLNTGEIKVAIPHTDYTYSNTTQLVVTTFKSPVEFYQMDNSSSKISVNLAVMILFNNPKKQPETLKYIMKIIQNQSSLSMIMKQQSKESMSKLFKTFGG
ncbi:PTS sugar transporter subunit IIA [Loigolactobacillus iwatensis]|uniref:PTS sugar transporter subunit IIA n=1 Tax=Loigolactobacillus iwatensis TaxID=1267156 RepID=UPI001CDC1C23|nr:PTS sugar transporter subunit IIA [Loigolactobacillus iwatensis]